MSAEAFTLPVKSVTFTRNNGKIGIEITPAKPFAQPGDIIMFGIDSHEGTAGGDAIQHLWDRALKV